MHYDFPGINEPDETPGAAAAASTVKNVIYTPSTLARMKKQKADTLTKSKEYIVKMLDARKDIVQRVFRNKNDNTIRCPVAFQSLIVNVHAQLGLTSNCAVDLTPLECFEMVESYFEKLKTISPYVKPNSLF